MQVAPPMTHYNSSSHSSCPLEYCENEAYVAGGYGDHQSYYYPGHQHQQYPQHDGHYLANEYHAHAHHHQQFAPQTPYLHQVYASAPEDGHAYDTVCVVCCTQQAPFPGGACSRRCGWVAAGSCSQCGRYRPNTAAAAVFCSPSCASEARQANWCVGCGVRQIPHGNTSCGAPRCIAAVQRIAARLTAHHNNNHHSSAQQQHAHHHHGGSAAAAAAVVRGRANSNTSSSGSSAAAGPASGRASQGQRLPGAVVSGAGKRRFEPHVVLSPADKVAAMVKQQLGSELGKRVVAVVKVGGSAELRKAYTAYRCRVEGEMNDVCGIGAPKFGHGGEGNEHRRYVAVQMRCDGRGFGSEDAHTCGAADCQTCVLLDAGAAAAHIGAECIQAFNTAANALAAFAPSTETPLRAIAVCRVVVGNPLVHSVADVAVSGVPVPNLAAKQHSTVVQMSDQADVAYVPVAGAAVTAVDAQYVVILQGDDAR